MVKYLLKINPGNINEENCSGFRKACQKNYLNIVQYLLTSPELKIHADIHALKDYGLRYAAANENIEIVKYLLTSPELNEHADIHACDEDTLRFACSYNYLDIVQYLLTSKDLKEKANVHINNDYIFKTSYEDNKNLISFLIFDCNIEKTQEIDNFIEDKKDIKELFNKRDLKENLEKTMYNSRNKKLNNKKI